VSPSDYDDLPTEEELEPEVVAPPPEDSWEQLEADMRLGHVLSKQYGSGDIDADYARDWAARITALREKDRVASSDRWDARNAALTHRIEELTAERDRLQAEMLQVADFALDRMMELGSPKYRANRAEIAGRLREEAEK
jgi:hypothetical protein